MFINISIIVTVYNVEKYLKECIESICKQKCDDIEIILVDDGSTDSSAATCDMYSGLDSRIKVIHQKNMGRVNARKIGLQNAIGRYVIFVDGDDWLEHNICVTLSKLQERYDADLITFGFIEEQANNKTKCFDGLNEGIYKSEQEMKFLLENSMICNKRDVLGILASMCTKLYKRDLAVEVVESIPPNLYRGEDILFNNLYLIKCKSVYILKEALYHYRMHQESTIHRNCPDLLEQIGITHNILTASLNNEYKQLQGLHIRTWLNVIRLWNKDFDDMLPMHIPYYCFDFGKVKGKRVVLYGAGKVGKDYYWQFKKMFSERLILWVDKNYLEIKNEKYNVQSVMEIKNVDYDVILIAIDSENIAMNIKKELIETYNISSEKIQWFNPIHYWV